MASIQIKDLTVGYGNRAILERCSLTVENGCLFTLLGPSGCGKTTLLRSIAGFIPVTSGQIVFGDKDVTHTSAHTRDVGLVFQDYALFPDKTIFENVAYGLRARHQSDQQIRTTVGEYLERVGLSGLEARRPAELSGGQRQRVALARALAIKPTVLLMDEPLSNLDAKLRLQVRETIRDLQQAVGITTILVTHDQEEALAMSDQIGLMRNGILQQVGTPASLYQRPNSAYTADFVGGANLMDTYLPQSLRAGDSTSVFLGQEALQGLSVRATAVTDLAAGPAQIIARAESLRISRQALTDALPVIVKRVQYLGSRTQVTTVLPTGSSLRVELQANDPLATSLKEGEATFAVFDPASTWLVSAQ
jgi:iron(III) transport system ATP-binding protein